MYNNATYYNLTYNKKFCTEFTCFSAKKEKKKRTKKKKKKKTTQNGELNFYKVN